MKNKRLIIDILFNIGSAAWGWITSNSFIIILMMAFNTLKGRGNNEDGKLFMPFGWILLILIAAITVAMVIFSVKRYKRKCIFIIPITLFIVAFVLGVIYTDLMYYDNYIRLFQGELI